MSAPASIVERLATIPDAPRVLTIGNFDGVHRGHLHLLSRVITTAARRDARSLVVTFEPHPISVLRPEHAPLRIATPAAKLEALRAAGIDDVVVLPFSLEVAAIEPEAFLELLAEAAQPTDIIVGDGFRFGKQRRGDINLMTDVGRRLGFKAESIPPLTDEVGVVSSSRIRTSLLAGDVDDAQRLIGRRYRLRGEVEHGAARGRDLGYPTANLQIPQGLCVPADGIYAAYAQLDDPESAPRQALVYIGTSPTFGDRERLVEVNILDYRGDLYSQDLEIEFVGRIRGDKTFESAEELMRQMGDDEVKSRTMLAGTHPERPRKGD